MSAVTLFVVLLFLMYGSKLYINRKSRVFCNFGHNIMRVVSMHGSVGVVAKY